MARFVTRRLGASVLTLWVILTLGFVLLRVAPGNPAEIWLGEFATPQTIAAFNEEHGLDKSIWVQYVSFAKDLARGDLGNSLNARQPVLHVIAGQYPATLELTAASLLLSIAIGMPLGALAALRRNTMVDVGASLAALTWLAMPSFWFGMLLLLLFSVSLGWFPLVGTGDLGSLSSTVSHLVLPALALGVRQAAVIARMFRSTILDVVSADYVRTARAKGVGEAMVMVKHVFRNALAPVVNIAAVDVIALMGGAVVIENVFSRSGVGSLLIQAVSQKDYPMIQGCLLFFSISVVLITLAADLIQAWLDPRVRLSGAHA